MDLLIKDLFKQMDDCCINGELKELQEFLMNPVVNSWSKENGLILACENGHVNIVDYLLTSPDLETHADLHTLDERPFKHALHYKQLDVIEYLIYKHEIQRNTEIIYIINLCKAPSIINTAKTVKAMFDAKEFHDKLNNSLDNKPYKIKIKL